MIIIGILLAALATAFNIRLTVRINRKYKLAVAKEHMNHKLFQYLNTSRDKLIKELGEMQKQIDSRTIHAHTKARVVNKMEKEKQLLEFLNGTIDFFEKAAANDN